jgi:hypothetical protein
MELLTAPSVLSDFIRAFQPTTTIVVLDVPTGTSDEASAFELQTKPHPLGNNFHNPIDGVLCNLTVSILLRGSRRAVHFEVPVINAAYHDGEFIAVVPDGKVTNFRRLRRNPKNLQRIIGPKLLQCIGECLVKRVHEGIGCRRCHWVCLMTP